MHRFFQLIGCVMVMGSALNSIAQTQIDAIDLALKSTGGRESRAWVLGENGYVGTYIVTESPQVTVKVSAAQQGLGDGTAQLNIAIADFKTGFNVAAGIPSYIATFNLPPGMYFVRIELTNHTPDSNWLLRINHVAIDGAQVLNENTDANALASANTYIKHFRRGDAKVRVDGAKPGAKAQVKLRRHAFMFGTAVAGYLENEYMIPDPPQDSDAAKFQQALVRHFNAVVPENAGKWVANEETRGQPTIAVSDAIFQFARDHNMYARQHNLIWDHTQQPQWVQELLDAAVAGDKQAAKDLRQAITDRIGYYVRDRAQDYIELDVLNESIHKRRYLNAFGVEGIAEIYNEVAHAAEQAGAQPYLFLNEYRLVQSSQDPLDERGLGSDPYANWYRRHAEDVIRAGAKIDGLGVQQYVNMFGDPNNVQSPAVIQQVFQNLSITGLRLTLTEFGANVSLTEQQAAQDLEDMVRMVFGTPNSVGFMMWGFWEKVVWERAPRAVFYDKDWKELEPARRWDRLVAEWNTDVTATVEPDGTITFRGFYGDYEITVNDKTYPLTLSKGRSEYTVGQ